MRSPHTRTALLGATAAALACGVLGGALGAAGAQAASVVATPTKSSPAFYVLKQRKAACKPHYRKTTVTIQRRRHGKLVRIKQLRCVYATTNSAGPQGTAPTFPVDLPTGTVSVSILPTVTAHTYGATAGQTLSVDGVGVLTGATGGQLSAMLVNSPPSGSLTLNRDGSFSYTPADGVSGVQHFAFKAINPSGESSTPASITIDVAPTAPDANYTVAAGSTLSIPAGGLLSGAVGSGLTTHVVSGPASAASFSLGADGSASYTPVAGFSGTDTFSFDVVDGSSLQSSAALVTVTVGSSASSSGSLPPNVVPEDYPGAFPNTQLQVGASSGGPAVRLGGLTALTGDSDPNGGSLSVLPGAIATIQGGLVHMSSNGDFTYDPPAGSSPSSDSFTYTVHESEGLDASAVATIDFAAAPRIWYVDDTAQTDGSGTSASPFNRLADVSVAAGNVAPTDVVYLFGGGQPYDGGITLGTNETLIGSGSSLVVSGVTLQGATSPAPTVTNTTSGGAGITLADGDSVRGLHVSGTAGDGILANGAGAFTLDSSVTVNGAGGADLEIDGGSGTITAGAQLSGSAAHSVLVKNRTGGTVTVSGAVAGSGGVLVQNDAGATVTFTRPITVSSGAQPAFAATGGGTVTATDATSTLATTTARALEVSGGSAIGNAGLTFLSVSAGTASSGPDHGIVLSGPAGNGSVTVLGDTGSTADGSGGTIQHTSGDAVDVSNVSGVELDRLDIVNSGGNGIDLVADGTTTIAVLRYDAVSGSTAGDGIDLLTDNAGDLGALLALNDITNITAGTGIDAQSGSGATLELELRQNLVTMAGPGSADGIHVSQSGAAGSVCVDPSLNAVTSSAANRFDLSLDQQATGAFAVDSLSGTNVPLFLAQHNQLGGGGASVSPNSGAFSSGSCNVPGGLTT